MFFWDNDVKKQVIDFDGLLHGDLFMDLLLLETICNDKGYCDPKQCYAC